MNSIFAFTMGLLLTGSVGTGEMVPIKCDVYEISKTVGLEVLDADEAKMNLVNYGRMISSGDMDFITTVEMESGRSPKSNGDGGLAYGLCQWRQEWHMKVIGDKRFKDPYRQADQCWKYYKEKRDNGTVANQLYGYRTRETVAYRFAPIQIKEQGVKCQSEQQKEDKNTMVEKYLLRKKIKYKLGSSGPEYFDCGGIVTHALKEVTGYTGQRITSHINAGFIAFKEAQRGDILISTISGERHVARISEGYSGGMVTVLDYVRDHENATYRQYGYRDGIKIMRVK